MPLLVAGALVAVGFGSAFAAKDEIKPQVKYAKTWEGAVAEAKALVVPLVVHNHGFY
jgi:hypothetical protein